METIEINEADELQPFDMIEEGMFIRAIHFRYYHYDTDYVVVEIGPCEIAEKKVPGQMLIWKYPKWGKLTQLPIKFPITVVRGVLDGR